MRLNLASGTWPTTLDGWLNVEIPWDGVKIDGLFVWGNALALPFADHTFDGAYCGHVLEHATYDEELPRMLAEVLRVCRHGAPVMVVGPDIDKAVATDQPEFLLRAIDTLGDGPGGHKWVSTEALTVRALVDAGFCEVIPQDVTTVAPPEYPNVSQAPWQLAVLASVP